MSLPVKILIENPGVVVLRNVKNGLEVDLFKIQFEDVPCSQSFLGHGESIFVCFSCDQLEFSHFTSLCLHLEQSSHREKEHEFIRKMHSEEMKVKSEIASKSLVKSVDQLLQHKPLYGIQYFLEFIPGDYDSLDLPIYVCTLPSCTWRGYARELLSHFENPSHILGYLHVNNVKQLDLEVAKDLYDFDTECSSKPSELLKRIVDTVSYHQISQGIYPFAVCKHIVSKVMVDKADNSLPKSYESFSRSRSANMTTVSSRKFSASELSMNDGRRLLDQEVLQSNIQQDLQDQEAIHSKDQESFQYQEISQSKDFEGEYFCYFTKEVKELILDEQEMNQFESFDVDKFAKEMAEEERLRHQRYVIVMIYQIKWIKCVYLIPSIFFRKGYAVETFCMNPSIARRISKRLAFKVKQSIGN